MEGHLSSAKQLGRGRLDGPHGVSRGAGSDQSTPARFWALPGMGQPGPHLHLKAESWGGGSPSTRGSPARRGAGGTCRPGLCPPRDESMQMPLNQKGKSKENASTQDEAVVTARQPPSHPTGPVAANRTA